jgi:hypothetical protein
LAITCDNASNNNALIQQLSEVVPSFGGQDARVRCFAHVVNLVVKSILSQFDAPTEGLDTADNVDLEESLIDLATLADGLIDDMEDEVEEVPPEEREADNNDGWVDERKAMSRAEQKALAKDVLPARRMVLKVSLLVHVGPLLVRVTHTWAKGYELPITGYLRHSLTSMSPTAPKDSIWPQELTDCSHTSLARTLQDVEEER